MHLPIDGEIDAILGRIGDRRRLVLIAPPGAGKTTRLPPALLRSGLLDPAHPRILVLQPRRVATRAVAARIAEENGWTLGREVGYRVRFENVTGPETRLEVVTEGILNRRLVADPFLEGVGAVILDEFHERSIHTDLALALVREVADAVRVDLILVVMSATLDPGPVARFLGDAAIVRVEGRAFPVAIERRPAARADLIEAAAAVASGVIAGHGPTVRDGPDDPGHVLVFLPGADEIRRVASRIGAAAEAEGAAVLPLHGRLTAEEQERALRPVDRRKVIVATNIAETSLTIDGVATVIDSGLARFASSDPERGLDRLELGRISHASAAQRAGRAGRTRPGRCIRLWSERDERGMPASDEPEVRRVDLAGTVLALHAWGQGDPARFGWFEHPPADRLASAGRLLAMLGATATEAGPITPLGRRMLAVPAHPRLARLLVAAVDGGFAAAGADLAALLSENDILTREDRGPRPDTPARAVESGSSDLIRRLDLLAEARRDRFSARLRPLGVDPIAARRVAQASDDLARAARRLERRGPARGVSEPDEDAILRAVLLAYPDRVARRRGAGSDAAVMVGGRGVRLDPASIVRDAELFVALDPRDARRGGVTEARVRIAGAIRAEWLEEFFPESWSVARTVRFDEARGRAVAVKTAKYRDLVIREDEHGAVDAAEGSRALAEFLRPRAVAFARDDEAAASWLARVAFLAAHVPEAGLPVFDDEALADAVASACAGRRTVEEARAVPLTPLLRGRLTHTQGRILDEEAPESLVLPSGNRARLDYAAGRAPILAARLQELFGWTTTPRLGRGRVAVLLHLLGPNYRPVQVTDDLASFWSSTYFQVRKDLRARYPKHSWPDDPLAARAEAKGNRRA